MRVINLDETGIKIIAANRKQIYLSIAEIKAFINKKYSLTDNILTIAQKKLLLTEKDMHEFPNIEDYICSNFANLK